MQQQAPVEAHDAPEVIHLGPKQDLLTKEALALTPDTSLAQPIIVLSDAMIDGYNKAVGRGAAIQVTDQASFDLAAEYLNNLTKFESMIKKSLKEKKEPANTWLDKIAALGDKLIDPLAGFKRATNEKMSTWKAKVDRERAEAIAKQKAETAKLLEEQKVKEAEQVKLAAQAKTKEAEALKKLDVATTDKQFNAGAAKFDESLALKAQAQAVVVPALPKDHASAGAAPSASPLAGSAAEDLPAPGATQADPPATRTIIPAAVQTKGRGIRPKETAEILEYDLALLPIRYHKLDDALLRKHILERVITVETPGVVFSIKEDFSGTGK